MVLDDGTIRQEDTYSKIKNEKKLFCILFLNGCCNMRKLAFVTLKRSSNNHIRFILGFLLAFAAINAFGGGYYGMSGAENVPLEWLDNSPFYNYFIPGLFLFVVVGGTFLFASVAVFAHFRTARFASFVSVTVVFAWLAVQIAIIGYVSLMQPLTGLISILILILTWFLPEQTKIHSSPKKPGKNDAH